MSVDIYETPTGRLSWTNMTYHKNIDPDKCMCDDLFDSQNRNLRHEHELESFRWSSAMSSAMTQGCQSTLHSTSGQCQRVRTWLGLAPSVHHGAQGTQQSATGTLICLMPDHSWVTWAHRVSANSTSIRKAQKHWRHVMQTMSSVRPSRGPGTYCRRDL